jgi:uncharacterized membrane protein YeiB
MWARVEFGRAGVLAGVGMAIVCFGWQMVFSHFWLKRYRIGLPEWLWRFGTNLKRPAFRSIPKQNIVDSNAAADQSG